MYKLTVEFKTVQEVIDFLSSKHGGNVATEEYKPLDIQMPGGFVVDPSKLNIKEEKEEKKEETKKKSSKKKAEKPEETEEEMEEVESPFASKPPVIPEMMPKEEKKEAPFDHAGGVKHAIALIGKLKSSGIPDSQHMPIAHEVYAQAGIPLATKISQFSNEQLKKFLPMFEKKVESLTSATEDSNSFI